MVGALTTNMPPLRNHIAMDEELEVKYWTKHLGGSREELQRAVDKVGKSAAAAVRKRIRNFPRDDEGLKLGCRETAPCGSFECQACGHPLVFRKFPSVKVAAVRSLGFISATIDDVCA